MAATIHYAELAGFFDAFAFIGLKPGYFVITNAMRPDRVLFYVVAFFRGRDHTDHFLKAIVDRRSLQSFMDKGFIRVEKIDS